MSNQTETNYQYASEIYQSLGVNTVDAINKLKEIPISLHCWQGDDVGGFETSDRLTGGGIQATGNFPGKARNADELRSDLEKAYSLIPGKHRLNLHAIYAETDGKKVNRNELTIKHFDRWLAWGKDKLHGIDFNPTYFSHPMADSGFTLSSADESVRKFWVEHGKVCRQIGNEFGKAFGTPTVTNQWIPDGYKDMPADRMSPRERLQQSLNEIFADKLDASTHLDAIESKLFGIGSESYVVGSHEFYMGYAVKNNKLLCLDTGHFHPTEGIADKISSILLYIDRVLLHVSRGVRWDSDHVVTLSDDLRSIAEELTRNNLLNRVHIGLDYFDASINRIAAWVIGCRNMQKALLIALLEPSVKLREMETKGDLTGRLATMEVMKTMPFGAVWDYFCYINNSPAEKDWLNEVRDYETKILLNR